MSLPRCLTADFFSSLADSVAKAGDGFFQEVHDCCSAVKILCLQQSCVAENKYLVEVLDGSVPVKYKHTCLALVPPTADGDKQLVGKVISFNQYKITPTKSRYLIILTKITIVPGDYRHLTCQLGPALVYHPGLSIQQAGQTPTSAMQPQGGVGTASGPIRKHDESLAQRKAQGSPYPITSSKPVVKTADAGSSAQISISDLTIYTPKWIIRARVSHKSQIRKFNNQWGEGQLFSVDLCDADGEIRATFFGEAVTKWYYFLEEGQVYSFSGGQLKPANKKFNNLSHSCEISMDENAQIQLDQNDISIPVLRCTFTPINQIDSVEIGAIIDVIGIIVRAREIKLVQHKGSGSNIEKRDVMLCDNSGASIWLTLWSKKVQHFQNNELDGHPLVAFKGVKVGEWQGRRLDTQASTKITVDPVIAEAAEIRQWWTTTGCQLRFDAGRQGQEVHIEDIVSIRQITKAANQALQFKSLGDNGITFTTRGIVEVIKESTFSWPACLECHRKMVNDQGQWMCTRCSARSKPKHTYILSLKIADDTGHLWASAANTVGAEIMNWVPAEELLALFEGGEVNADGKNFMNVFEEARLSEFIFKVRVTSEKYMDELRIKYRIAKAFRVGKHMDAAITCRMKDINELLE
ncbi:replication factor-a protein 1 (rpa1) family protein, putative [Babesia bigemina]|uniref:Replication protein A subunit n=1 Tax=Babesia bigemina TaxID=5866 RepID=A0A061CZM0_BABBI|nr:replication factor-a protein 1 (rpa1) family protein, putative [Babesia bigemina]CDR93843.1 replication factor-a protein 1 (rpa1) family protein, putative [Babesia bigemina]|eukprot:XP_012766029.1 replication factor-a protein 1 (rpa1) family protein, putative [Babesia bigemina]